MKRLSSCTLDCPDTCSFVVDAEGRRITGNPDHPYTKGFICPKGGGMLERLGRDDRITSPMLRHGGDFAPIDWDTALNLCAKKIDALRGDPTRILHIRGHGYRGVLANAAKVLFRSLGASGIMGSLCDEAGIAASIADFGALAHNRPEDLLHAERIINWGRELSRSSLHTGALVRKARQNGAEVLTITPGGDGNDEYSDVVIRVRPGTDRFLAAAVIRLFMESGIIETGILSRTANWPAFRGLVEGWSLKDLCRACDVPMEDVELLFDWYAEPGAAATLIGWGLQRYLFGGENVRFINALGLLAGQVGRSGGGVYYNVASSRFLTKWQPESGAEHEAYGREFFVGDLGREMLAAEPPVDFVWVDGMNPVTQAPEGHKIAEAFERAGFVVVVDGFLNDTCEHADLILPPAMMLEHEDALGSCAHHCVNLSAKVMNAPGECREGFEIMADLGRRLDPPVVFPDRETALRRGLEPQGIDLGVLRETGFVEMDEPRIAFEGLRFGHADEKFHFVETLHAEPGAETGYPLRLLTLVRGDRLHSQIPPEEQEGLPIAYIAPDCAGMRKVDPKRHVYLVSPQGKLRVRLQTLPELHPEAVIVRRGGWSMLGHNANPLIAGRPTDMGPCTALYSQQVRLENG